MLCMPDHKIYQALKNVYLWHVFNLDSFLIWIILLIQFRAWHAKELPQHSIGKSVGNNSWSPERRGKERKTILNWLCSRREKTVVFQLSPTEKAVGFYFKKNYLREASLFNWHSWVSCRFLWGMGMRDPLSLEDVTCLTTPKTQPPQQTQHFSVADYIYNVSSPVWYSWYWYMQNSCKPEGDLAFSCTAQRSTELSERICRYCCVREESWGSKSCNTAPFPAWWPKDKHECVGRSSTLGITSLLKTISLKKKHFSTSQLL